ncbi:sialate O-acetylesterase [Paenibacillus sp. FSL L8-0470]|uniref:sialate O-acetylesterase n=1 Tax=unclassified Paenibacillus TaxID=185978 RepID=UPI0030F81547
MDESVNQQTVDLVMFMGQSNMAGRGTAEQAPVVPSGTGYEFRSMSDPARLYEIMEPFGVNENNAASGVSETIKTGSMISAFAIEYYKLTSRPVVGVSCSKGGTSINQWQPEGAFLNDAIDRFHLADRYLERSGYCVKHKFMVWCQGETDGDLGMSAAEYKFKLSLMIEAMLAAGLEHCYLIRTGNNRDQPALYNPIKAAQTELCKEYANTTLVSAKFEEMSAKGQMSDAFHYTQKAYNITGADAGRNTALHILNLEE